MFNSAWQQDAQLKPMATLTFVWMMMTAKWFVQQRLAKDAQQKPMAMLQQVMDHARPRMDLSICANSYAHLLQLT